MKKKILVVLMAVCTLFCASFAFSGCWDNDTPDTENSDEEETYGFTVTVNDLYHISNSSLGDEIDISDVKFNYFRYYLIYTVSGNLSEEITYNVNVQIGIYANGEYSQTVNDDFELKGNATKQHKQTIKFMLDNSYAYSVILTDFVAKTEITYKILKITWL